MKKFLTCMAVALACASLSVNASTIENLISPNSLDKNVLHLNKTYQLGLKKSQEAYIDGKKVGNYFIGPIDKCQLKIIADSANKIKQITVNTTDCNFTTESNVKFNSQKTSSKGLLNQAILSQITFYPGCYNCPSRIEIRDTLVINRPQDKFYTEFEIEGYNTNFKEYIVKKLSEIDSNISADKWRALSQLDDLQVENASSLKKLINSRDIKEKAVDTYHLNTIPSTYTITLKSSNRN